MATDLEIPEQPDLTNRGVPAHIDADDIDPTEYDLRRQELEDILFAGAWREGFEEWAQYTELLPEDIAQAEQFGLFEEFDFYWDPDLDRLRYVTPTAADGWEEESTETSVETVLTELDELGRTVAECVATEVDWTDERIEDIIWSVESFGQIPTNEE